MRTSTSLDLWCVRWQITCHELILTLSRFTIIISMAIYTISIGIFHDILSCVSDANEQ